MPGVKGKSGGPRPKTRSDDGRGRPVAKRTLRADNEFYVSRKYPDGVLPGELWKVVELSRTIIVLQSSDGSTITLVN